MCLDKSIDTSAGHPIPQLDTPIFARGSISLSIWSEFYARNSSRVLMTGDAADEALRSVDVVQPHHRMIRAHNEKVPGRMKREAPNLVRVGDGSKSFLDAGFAVVEKFDARVSTARYQDRLPGVKFEARHFVQVVVQCANHGVTSGLVPGCHFVGSGFGQHSIDVEDLDGGVDRTRGYELSVRGKGAGSAVALVGGDVRGFVQRWFRGLGLRLRFEF